MKVATSFVVLFVCGAASVLVAEQKWTGQIGDSMCGVEAKHSLGPDGKPMSARDCARDCVKQGGSYVLISQGKVFKLVTRRQDGCARERGLHGGCRRHIAWRCDHRVEGHEVVETVTPTGGTCAGNIDGSTPFFEDDQPGRRDRHVVGHKRFGRSDRSTPRRCDRSQRHVLG